MIPRASYKKVIQSLGGSANHEPKYNSGKARYIKAPMQKKKISASKNYSYRFPMYLKTLSYPPRMEHAALYLQLDTSLEERAHWITNS